MCDLFQRKSLDALQLEPGALTGAYISDRHTVPGFPKAGPD